MTNSLISRGRLTAAVLGVAFALGSADAHAQTFFDKLKALTQSDEEKESEENLRRWQSLTQIAYDATHNACETLRLAAIQEEIANGGTRENAEGRYEDRGPQPDYRIPILADLQTSIRVWRGRSAENGATKSSDFYICQMEAELRAMTSPGPLATAAAAKSRSFDAYSRSCKAAAHAAYLGEPEHSAMEISMNVQVTGLTFEDTTLREAFEHIYILARPELEKTIKYQSEQPDRGANGELTLCAAKARLQEMAGGPSR